MTNFYNDLSSLLRESRIAWGLKQHEVATLLNLSRSSITYYEEGKVTPGIYALRKLSEIYGIPPERFFYPERYVTLPGSAGK